VRAYNGRNSRWYKAAVKQRAGRITAAGMARDVAFEPVDGPIGGRIDDAYRAKYAGSSYLGSMVSERARAATIRIMPREDIEKDRTWHRVSKTRSSSSPAPAADWEPRPPAI
jgi:hypothetical protein